MLWKSAWCFAKTVPGVCIAFAITWMFVFALEFGQTGAAWIQAIGSIAAIFMATYIAHEDRQVQQQVDSARAQVIYAAIFERIKKASQCLLDIDYMLGVYSQRHKDDLPLEDLEALIRVANERIAELKSIDLMQLPSPEAVYGVLDIISCLENGKMRAQYPRLYARTVSQTGSGALTDLHNKVKGVLDEFSAAAGQ